jgi:hypothetical protein
MQRQNHHITHSEELERKMLEAADALRKNQERGRTVGRNLARYLKERNKVIELPATLDEEEEEGEEEEPF